MKHYLSLALVWGLLASGFISTEAKAQAAVFPADLVGSYEADLVASGVTQGKAEFAVTNKGVASGKLYMPNGKSYSFSAATLAVDGTSAFKNLHVVVKGKFPAGPQPLQMNLRVYSDGSVTGATQSSIEGLPFLLTMANGVRLKTFTGKAGDVAPWQGAYTLSFANPTPAGANTPAGAGYASVVVAANGQLTLKAKLADGTSASASLKPNDAGVYRLMLLPYSAGGFFSAELAFTKGAGDRYSVVSGEAVWKKSPKTGDKAYPAGFGPVVTDVNAQPWIKPAAGETLAGILGAVGKQISFSLEGAGLDAEGAYLGQFPQKLEISAKNELLPVFGDVFAPATAAAWAKLWKVKINPTTGVYTGTLNLRDLEQAAAVGTGKDAQYTPVKFVNRKITIEGVLMQDFDNALEPFSAAGFFLLPPLNAKTSTTLAGGTEASGPLEPLGTGGPVIGAISPGTPGNYTTLFSKVVEFDYGSFASYGGFSITVNGALKSIPENNATVPFTIASDLSSITFNGKKLPLVGDSRPVALVFSNASATNFKDSLTVITYLDTTTGRVTAVAGQYVQLLSGSVTIPGGVYGGIRISGRTVSAPIPGVVYYTGGSVNKTL